jgi:TRAP transporter TAXI family solute receptor
MKQRAAGLGVLGVAGVFVLAVLGATGFGTVNGWAQRISFAIATGPSSGTYFPAGEIIAGLVSHPPGVDRCSRASVCGPEGLIAAAQTSPGSYANVLSVNTGRVDSALAQSDVVAQAVRGDGVFRGKKQTHVRVIAALFPEDIHIVARAKLHIASVADLRGKRVSIGALGSGTAVTARMVLAAYRPRHVQISTDSADSAAQKLQAGKIDAFFFVGGAPVPLVRALISSGQALLVPIDGPARDRLIADGQGFAADTIPASAYGAGTGVATLSVQSLWIVNDQEPADIVFALTRALFNPANRSMLNDGPHSVGLISVDRATQDLPALLHPGAERFYKEAGKEAKYTIDSH